MYGRLAFPNEAAAVSADARLHFGQYGQGHLGRTLGAYIQPDRRIEPAQLVWLRMDTALAQVSQELISTFAGAQLTKISHRRRQ